MNKQIFLVLIIICSLSYSQSLQTPTPLSPGIPSPGIESVDFDNITFKWKSADDTDGYAFVITEYDGQGYFNLIYSSGRSGIITDTTFILEDNILKQNKIYRWKVRSLKGYEWSSYSEKLRFQLKKVEEEPEDINVIEESQELSPTPSQSSQTPVPVSPGVLYPGITPVDSDNMVFSWQSLENVDGYSFVITEYDGKGYFNLIYNSRPDGNITDTTFTLDKKIFKQNKIYRWKIRAIKDNKWGSYSEKLRFQIKNIVEVSPDVIVAKVPQDVKVVETPRPITTNTDAPVLVSPGNNSYEDESPVNLPVLLKWNKMDDAVEYVVIVGELQNDGLYKLIYNSQNEIPLIDTTLTLPSGILKQGSSYRWNIRAGNDTGWGKYSGWKYFTIKPPDQPVIPTPIQPGTLSERSRAAINTLTPYFTWHSIEGSSFYNVVIFRKSRDGSFNEIYNNDSVPNNIFQLPDEIISDSKIYKWNVRALIDTQWTEFSNDLFFSPHIQSEPDIASPSIMVEEPEEVYLSITYAGVLNGMVSSIFYRDKVFIPVSEVFTSLEINNNVDYDSNAVSGYFILQERLYNMDFQKDSVYVGDTVYSFTDEDVIEAEFDYFLSTELYKEIFGINFELDFSNLALKTYSDFDLPILSRHIRETNYSFIEGIKAIGKPEITFERNRSLFNFGLFDYFLSAAFTKDNDPSGQYNFALGGEVLGGDLNLATRGVFFNGDISNTDIDYKWRYVFQDEKYITSVSGGFINSSQGLESFNYRGVRVTNEPIEPRRGYGTYRIFDVTNPNWTVELYIGNQLVDIARADAAGDFHFDIPLSYGTTLAQLKYYGPGGEFYIANKLYQTPFLLLRVDEFNYAVDLGEIPFTNQRLANVYGGYGIANWLTNKTGIEYVENSNGDTPVFYNSTTARYDGNYLFNLTLAPSAFYSLSANVRYYDQTTIDVSYTNYQNHGFYNLTDLKHELTGHLTAPISFAKWRLNIRSDLTYRQSDSFESYESVLGVSAVWRGLNPFINYRFSDFYFSSQKTSRSIIDAGFSWSIYKMPTFLLFMTGNIFSARTFYRTQENEFESLRLSYSGNIFSNTRIQLSQYFNILNNSSQTQLQFIVYFPFTQYSAQLSNNAISQTVLGSIGYDHDHESLKFYSRQQIGRAAVSFVMFVDGNGNDQYDSGEEIIKDARILMGSSVFRVNEDGTINAYELNSYTHYSVKIEEESIKNPLLIPKYKVFDVVTDPNNFKTIEIPFYVAGEISGYLYRKVGNRRTNLSGVRLHIESLDDEFKTQVNSFLNGSFYYFGLKPGKYKVYIDPDQLNAMKVESNPAEMEVEVKADPYGDFIEDLIFVVE